MGDLRRVGTIKFSAKKSNHNSQSLDSILDGASPMFADRIRSSPSKCLNQIIKHQLSGYLQQPVSHESSDLLHTHFQYWTMMDEVRTTLCGQIKKFHYCTGWLPKEFFSSENSDGFSKILLYLSRNKSRPFDKFGHNVLCGAIGSHKNLLFSTLF